MALRTTVVGSYPKVTKSGSDNLPGTIDRWQRKQVTDEMLEQELQKVIRRVIGEQEQAGISLITDGQIRWEDLFHPIARSARGIERGALRRFFDNNVYYRRLQLSPVSPGKGEILRESGGSSGEVQWQKSAVAEEYAFASQVAKRPVKGVLPGPLTLVISTEPKPGQSPEKLLSLYSDLLRKEVEALVAAGAKEIQLDEPAFKAGEPLLLKTVEAINRIFQGITPPPASSAEGGSAREAGPATGRGRTESGGGVKARRWVACYFQDLSSILPMLAKLQVEVLSLDLVATPIASVREFRWPGEVALGLLDARNTKLESVGELQKQIREVAKSIPVDRLWLSPSCGLEFLPHEAAVKKLELLKQVARNGA